MDKKSKILLGVVFLLIVASIGATYWRIFVKKDYVIENQVDCDPTVDKCFIWKCDPASTTEGEACTGDPEKDIWYYQIAKRGAANIPMCDPDKDETCDPWTCAEDEKDCSQTFCDETTKEEQRTECNDPVQYAINNPAEEESACEEGDEECLAAEEATECEEGDTECEAAAVASGEAVACDPQTEDCSDTSSATVSDEGNNASDETAQTE